MSEAQGLTQFFSDWDREHPDAMNRLVEKVYKDLHGQACRAMRHEREDHTLQPTALVNEVYLRLARRNDFGWRNGAHFRASVSRTIRRILVDHARRRSAKKRGAGFRFVQLEEDVLNHGRPLDLVLLDDCLRELEQLMPRQSSIVELRFFGGLTIEEVAEVLDLSSATVKLDWNMARAWMRRRFEGGKGP